MQRQEFETLALEHMDAVYRLALQLTRHPDEASDLVQETFLRALRSAGGFQEKGGGMRSWLFTILHNAFYTRIKKQARGPTSVEEFHEPDERQIAPGEASPAWDLKSLDWEHVDDQVARALDDLSPEHRETLLLWGVEGMKYREIAEIMGVPIGTVMSRLHRARGILAENLEDFAREHGWNREPAGSNPDRASRQSKAPS